MNLGVSTYSFWHFERSREPLKHYLELAARYGFSGVEVLWLNLESLSTTYL
ncbi:MAG: sugar phosphate isomerase/epimerase, partial [Thermoprotei archaeon]